MANNQDFVWQELPSAGSKNGQCTLATKFYGHKPYYAEKYCDKRFLDRVINLIPDLGLKALWSLIPFFWALSPFLWALIPVLFWALSPEPIYHVTTLLYSCYPRCLPIMWRISAGAHCSNVQEKWFCISPSKIEQCAFPRVPAGITFYGLCLYECSSCFQNL